MNTSKPEILIVEDEAIVAKHIKMCLTQFNYESIGIASTGEDAVRMTETFRPNLVLMDIKLKGAMDGIDVAQQLRNRFNTPVLFLTAYSSQDLLDRAKVTQPYGYLLKPFNDRELHSSIEMALYKHNAETVLHNNQTRLKHVLNSIGDAVITTDTEQKITFLNPVAQYLTGWGEEEAMGRPLGEVFNIQGRATEKPAQDLIDRVLRDGTPLRTRGRIELLNRGNERIPIDTSASPIKSPKGNIAGMVITFQDVSEQEKEKKALLTFTEKLHKSNVALTEFASNASHDLKEPLRKIILFGDRLQATLADYPLQKEKDYLARQQKSALKMMGLIDQLLEWAKITGQPASFVITDLNSIAQSAMEDLGALIEEKRGQVHIKSLPTLRVDPLQIRRLLQNLVGNALKFHKTNEPPIVTLESRLLENGFWEIRIEDNGIGFKQQDAERLFKPFVRLHASPHYKGSGIGAAICKDIVEKHNGTLTAKSTPEKGSTLIITLPAMDAQKENTARTS